MVMVTGRSVRMRVNPFTQIFAAGRWGADRADAKPGPVFVSGDEPGPVYVYSAGHQRAVIVQVRHHRPVQGGRPALKLVLDGLADRDDALPAHWAADTALTVRAAHEPSAGCVLGDPEPVGLRVGTQVHGRTHAARAVPASWPARTGYAQVMPPGRQSGPTCWRTARTQGQEAQEAPTPPTPSPRQDQPNTAGQGSSAQYEHGANS